MILSRSASSVRLRDLSPLFFAATMEIAMPKNDNPPQDTTLAKIWDFLEAWNDRMTETGAENHIDEFLADMDRFKTELVATRQVADGTPGPTGQKPGV